MALSVVIVLSTARERAQRVVDLLAPQAETTELDVVIVDLLAGREAPLTAPAPLSLRTIACSAQEAAEARTAGLHAARHELVAFLEDHCYPQPGWAAAVEAAFESDAAVVGYSFAIDNPHDGLTPRSEGWAQMTGCLHIERPVKRRFVNAGNVAYRRSAVAGLESLLGQEFLLQTTLFKRGETLMIAPGARVRHEHFTRWRDAFGMTAASGRALAGARIREGRWSRRMRATAALAVLGVAPAKRVGMLVRRLAGRPELLRDALPALPGTLAIIACAAVAESSGYLRPPTDERNLMRYELDVPRRP